MIIQEFFIKWLNKGIDYDNYYGFQCMDVYRQFVKEVLNLPQSPPVRGACDVWTTYLKDKYDRFDNTPTAVPLLGDIVIWDDNAGGGFGHIAIAVSGNINEFVSFDQNWPVNSLCHYQKHSYKNVLGWIRPKPVVPPPTTPAPTTPAPTTPAPTTTESTTTSSSTSTSTTTSSTSSSSSTTSPNEPGGSIQPPVDIPPSDSWSVLLKLLSDLIEAIAKLFKKRGDN